MLGVAHSEHILADLNHINLVLIPMKNKPTSMTELWPIALCKVLYKALSKFLANRLKRVLLSIVLESQSAFVEGRLIIDNIVVANEIAHFVKGIGNKGCGYASLKIDIAKAHDLLEWDYLEAMLRALGFAEKWVNLLMMCVRFVSYNILFEDNVIGPITPGRGLPQGDPISPFLFILAAEGLLMLIQKKRRG